MNATKLTAVENISMGLIVVMKPSSMAITLIILLTVDCTINMVTIVTIMGQLSSYRNTKDRVDLPTSTKQELADHVSQSIDPESPSFPQLKLLPLLLISNRKIF
jgi:hypothetical protein